MSFTQLLNTVTATGLSSLAEFDRATAEAAGLSPTTVSNWEKLHRTYYGPTTCPKQQAVTRRLAVEGAFSLDQLLLIERRLESAARAEKEHLAHDEQNPTGPDGCESGGGSDRSSLAMRQWKLRQRLLSRACRYSTLEKKAKELVSITPIAPKESIRFSRSTGGKRTFSVTTDERLLADLEHALSVDLDVNAPAGPQMLRNFSSLVRSGADSDGLPGFGVPRAVPRPQLLVPLQAHVRVLEHTDDDTLLGLTDGTSILASDYLKDFFNNPDYGLEAALFHPVEGPVNLYRVERHANRKQRDLVSAAMPHCVVPGCRQPADNCQMHHMTAWKHGGYTNVSNLVPLCRYHNQVNDDDAFATSPAPAGTAARGAAPGSASSASAGASGAAPSAGASGAGAGAGGAGAGTRRPHKTSRRGRHAGAVVPVGPMAMWCSPAGYVVPNDTHPSYGFGAMHALYPEWVPPAARSGSPPTHVRDVERQVRWMRDRRKAGCEERPPP
ncbi:HNH endonuclease [Corynebacterium aquatimens]|uniref:HNH nuclease domain-containing protein n=1 Tax=Corynebacterium aquatimens TaxID=1190508 RepID=A0A931GTV5_9CORY|nr:HNH endonuclease [Corynebacterium aquatimens]MBG6122175.1 hypothetical protein [Corynebacterium aquatimens]WJY65284.1 hypothetical protein CAQUA_02835 [Corynebacterium aquatimens]